MKIRNVQISEKLFLELYQLHVLKRVPPVVNVDYIETELQNKFDAWQRHIDYSADIERKKKIDQLKN